MKLRVKMVMYLDYLCRRNQPGTWKKIHGVLATVRELHAASKIFNNVLSRIEFHVPDVRMP